VPSPSVAGRVRWSLVNSLCGLGASAVSYAVIARYVDPAEYGRATILLAVWGLWALPIDWCGSLMMRYGPIELSRDGSLRVTNSTRMVFVVPSLLLLLPTAPAYLYWARGWTAPLAALTAASLAAATALSVAQWCAVAAQRFALLAASNVIVRGALPLLIVAQTARLRGTRAEAMATAVTVGSALGAALLLVGLRRVLGVVRPDGALLRAMWRYSLPGLLATPSLAAISYLDPILLARCASHADVGRYQFAYVTVTAFGMLSVAINNVLTPELVASTARGDPGAVEHYRRAFQPRLALALGLPTFAGALVAGPLARLFLPLRYAAAADVAALLCVASGLLLGVSSFHPLVSATDSVWPPQIASLVAAATNVVLDVVLAPGRGATGIALANIAAALVNLVLLALLMRRRMGARLLAVGPLAACGTLAGALLAGGASFGARLPVAALFLVAGATTWATRRARAQETIVAAGRRGAGA
jgi:O-antigen/teichoic acid export membrane protein